MHTTIMQTRGVKQATKYALYDIIFYTPHNRKADNRTCAYYRPPAELRSAAKAEDETQTLSVPKRPGSAVPDPWS